MKRLEEVESFGSIDADNDDLLLECFEDHEAYNQILAFQKFLIVGKKGSGKTAIFKRLLTTHSHNFFTFGHTFSDYPWHYHDTQQRIGIPDFDRYTHSWKYLILLSLSKTILNFDQSLPYDESSLDHLGRIERFVIDTYGTRDPDITQVFTPNRKLRLRPAFEFVIQGLKAGLSLDSVPISELPTIIQEVNKNLIESIFASLNPDNTYIVCFDQLDLGFEPDNANYSNRLIGLMLAARDLNIEAKTQGKKAFVVVFLRDDIFENLRFDDKNKLTDNFLTRIEWDTPRTSKTLRSIMEKRFAKTIAGDPGAPFRWDRVFDETRQMTGHQQKYQHMLDRTFLRPRDIIKFCNVVLSQFKLRCQEARKNQAQVPTMFDNEDVNRARAEYGNYFLNELQDEIHKHIPSYESQLEVFRSLGVLSFTRQDFDRAFEARKSLLGEGAEPLAILRHLFEFSVIGFYRAGGYGYGGSEYIYRYKDSRARFDEKAEKLRVHPGLMEVLGLKKYTW